MVEGQFNIRVNPEVLKATLHCTIILAVKFFFSLFMGLKTSFAAGVRAPEDGTSFASKDVQQDFGLNPRHYNDRESQQAALDCARWKRIVGNDLETIIFGLIVAWTTLLYHYSSRIQMFFIALFCIARILHTVFFAAARNPHRSFAWFASWVAIFGMLVNTSYAVGF
mmetsp:Transcript_63191/g.72456  ORF Transcript_63191/g.72456 Transcript_63191/m.72456 type:complete len:167 (+) Transcript_63191:77-577(+)